MIVVFQCVEVFRNPSNGPLTAPVLSWPRWPARIEGLAALQQLKKLVLSYNHISGLEGMAQLHGVHYKLEYLDLTGVPPHSARPSSPNRWFPHSRGEAGGGALGGNPMPLQATRSTGWTSWSTSRAVSTCAASTSSWPEGTQGLFFCSSGGSGFVSVCCAKRRV